MTILTTLEVNRLTKDYGNGKGVFDLSLSVNGGEVFGFLGPNGAGKTTTIRNIMGFSHPTSGSCSVMGLDCRTEQAKIQKKLGYLPGEIAFFDNMNGMDFIRFIAKMKGMSDFSRADELINMFGLDPRGKIKRMSKGMKQKIGIVCAFMGNPEIIILDEPTSGLDPLMQKRFDELVMSERDKGRTIFMSSHIFEEIEKCCDRVAIIKGGRLMAVKNMQELKAAKTKEYVVTFSDSESLKRFADGFNANITGENEATVTVAGSPDGLIRALSAFNTASLDVRSQSLEELFMHFYGENADGRA